MHNFCTLFDSNYLLRGLAMHASLLKYLPVFRLYIFAFDDNVYNLLTKLNLRNVTVISLKEFEDNRLLAVKPGRNKVEYCWTCTSSTILYCLEKFSLDQCTYLDADILFFASPQILFDELGERSIFLTEHRFHPDHDKSWMSGKYCVQFITFKNDEPGLKALRWWREACLKWCYARLEDGKFGDQKYLDDWPQRFAGVVVTNNLGAGVAPWNVSSYDFYRQDKEIYGRELKSNKEFKVIFFHYHHAKIFKIFGKIKSKYFEPLNKASEKIFYEEYDKALNKVYQELKRNNINTEFDNIKEYFSLHLRENAPAIIKNIYRKIKYGQKNQS